MNIEKCVANIQYSLTQAQKEIESQKAEIAKCMATTLKVLDECTKEGIDKICLASQHKSVPTSMSFGFGFLYSAFAEKKSKTGCPAVWSVCERAGIYAGCGNHNQAQIHPKMIIEGTYHYKNGYWRKIKEGEDK